MNSNTLDQFFGSKEEGQESGNIQNTISGFEVAMTGLFGRIEAAINRQQADANRQIIIATQTQIIAGLKKMSSQQVARKFAKTFKAQGCFNSFNVTEEERNEMISALLNQMMVVKFGSDWNIEPSMVVKMGGIETTLGMNEKKPAGRFDEAAVRAIRIAHLAGESYRKIGKRYGVSGDMIRSICIGESYKDIAKELIDGVASNGKSGETYEEVWASLSHWFQS